MFYLYVLSWLNKAQVSTKLTVLHHAGLPPDVLPLLAAGLLPGAADGDGVGGGVQGGAARAAVPRALHAAAAAHHGLRQGELLLLGLIIV